VITVGMRGWKYLKGNWEYRMWRTSNAAYLMSRGNNYKSNFINKGTMITVQKENGTVLFFNENEHIYFAFAKEQRKFMAYPKQEGIQYERVDVEDVVSVTYINNAHPTIQVFQSDRVPPQPSDYENESIFVVSKEIDKIDIQEREEKKKTTSGRVNYQKNGYEIRFLNACKANGIETVGQLIAFGSKFFEESRNFGKKCCDILSQALNNLYGIEKW
jgi:hydroxymethylpyrimidine pyrophosphatase-like HAD family hydrolase